MDEQTRLITYINMAFIKLYTNDSHLIYNTPIANKTDRDNHHAGERSIVFRFAHYLQNLISDDIEFKDYNLDCEYNRNGPQTKALPSFPNGTYPDLIIHKRGTNEHNLLIMEFKTYWNNDQSQDIIKIREFLDQNGEYKFKYGASVLIDISEPRINWI